MIMLTMYFENSTSGVIESWLGRVSILLVIGGRLRNLDGRVIENGLVDISDITRFNTILLVLIIILTSVACI